MIFGGYPLVPHPDTPPRTVSQVSFTYIWRSAGRWSFDFQVGAPPASLLLPAAAEPERTDGLWEHSCFELFLLDPESGAYLEFNLSPSGQWAAYRFDAYREGRRDLDVARPRILTPDRAQFALSMAAHLRGIGLDEDSIRIMLEMEMSLPEARSQFALNALLEDPDLGGDTGWRAGVSAVIEETDGTKSYWALAHPPGPPDFHHPDCFLLELSPASDADLSSPRT